MTKFPKFEKLTPKQKRKVDNYLNAMGDDTPLSPGTESHLAYLEYVKADFASGSTLAGSLLGATSLLIALVTVELHLPVIIFSTVLLIGLTSISFAAGIKYFHKDAAQQVAFTVYQLRRAEEKSNNDKDEILKKFVELKRGEMAQRIHATLDSVDELKIRDKTQTPERTELNSEKSPAKHLNTRRVRHHLSTTRKKSGVRLR